MADTNTDTNTDSVALKKLRNAEYQRKYRAKLTEQQLITLNSSKASTNRNRYNTDPNYKFNKNLYNKDKAKDNRNKAKLYDSIINSTQSSTDTILTPTDTTQDSTLTPTDTTQDSTLTPTDTTQDSTLTPTDTTQSSTLHSKHIFCVSCNQSYNKYYFSKHLTSKKHINNYTS